MEKDLLGQKKVFLESNRQNLFRIVEKSWKNQTFWSQQSSNFFLKLSHFDHFPRPGEIDPYAVMQSIYWSKYTMRICKVLALMWALIRMKTHSQFYCILPIRQTYLNMILSSNRWPLTTRRKKRIKSTWACLGKSRICSRLLASSKLRRCSFQVVDATY